MIKDLWKENGTFWLLEEYGLWANQPADLHLNYPKKSAFVQMQGRSVPLPRIDDHLAGHIQDTLNDLGEHRMELKEVLVLYHVRRKSMGYISSVTGNHRKKVADLLHSGEAWIDRAVYDYFKKLEQAA